MSICVKIIIKKGGRDKLKNLNVGLSKRNKKNEKFACTVQYIQLLLNSKIKWLIHEKKSVKKLT